MHLVASFGFSPPSLIISMSPGDKTECPILLVAGLYQFEVGARPEPVCN